MEWPVFQMVIWEPDYLSTIFLLDLNNMIWIPDFQKSAIQKFSLFRSSLYNYSIHFVFFQQALMRSLHCYEPSQNQINFVPLLVQMIPKEDYDIQVKLIGIQRFDIQRFDIQSLAAI